MVVFVAKDGVVGAGAVEKVLILIQLSFLLYSFLCVYVSKDWLICMCDSVSVFFLFSRWDHGSVTVSWRINREDICWL